MMDLSIIPECYVDTNLIETLVPTKQGYNHQKGCGTVTKVMKGQFQNSFAVGIIDRDKKEVDYMSEFDEVHQKGSLTLHKHHTRHHYIIQISPAVERFLLKEAALCHISMKDHNLPDDMDLLKKISKTANSKDDPRFKGLVKAIRKAGSADFNTLINWISYLKLHNYQANVEALKVHTN